MRKGKFEKIRNKTLVGLAVVFALPLIAFAAAPAAALTAAEVKPAIFKALGHEVPQ